MKLAVVVIILMIFTGCSTFKSEYVDVKDYDFSNSLDELQVSNPELETYSLFNNDYPVITMESIYREWGDPDSSQTAWLEIGIRTTVSMTFGVTGVLAWPLVLGSQVIAGPPCKIETWSKENKRIEVESCPKWMAARGKSYVKNWEWTQTANL